MPERTLLQLVSCATCTYFKPDITHLQGTCAVIDATEKEQERQRRFIECGAKLCYLAPSNKPDRVCQHHLEKYPFTVGD